MLCCRKKKYVFFLTIFSLFSLHHYINCFLFHIAQQINILIIILCRFLFKQIYIAILGKILIEKNLK